MRPLYQRHWYSSFNGLSYSVFALVPSHTYEVTYKFLIDGYDYDHLQFMHREDLVHYADSRENHGPVISTGLLRYIQKDFKLTSAIPPVFRNIYPNLKHDLYRKLKLEPGFLKKTTVVCEDCIFEISKSKEGNLGIRLDQGSDEGFGMGQLRPDTLRNRFNVAIIITILN